LAKPNCKRLHKLAVDDSQSDLRPPAGIAVLKADQFLLQLRLGHSQADGDQASLEAGHVSPDHVADDLHGFLGDDNADDALMFDGSNAPVDDAGGDLDIVDRPPTGASQEPMLHETDLTTLVGHDTAQSKHGGRQDSLVAFVDATLRYAITSRPKRNPRGICLKHDGRLSTLQDIAPAIWSPGYLSVRAHLPFWTSPAALTHCVTGNDRKGLLHPDTEPHLVRISTGWSKVFYLFTKGSTSSVSAPN